MYAMETLEIQKSFKVQNLEIIVTSSILMVLHILALCIQIIFLMKKQILMVFWTV